MIEFITDIRAYKKTNTKKVLFLQYGDNDFSLYDKASSGTTKCGLELFEYLNSFDEYTCSYACVSLSTTCEYAPLNDYFDIVVFNDICKDALQDLSNLRQHNPNIKSLFIVHCLDYRHLERLFVYTFNNLDKYVCVGPNSYSYCMTYTKDKSKVDMIYNPIDVSKYENLKFDSKDNQILISYHPFKGNVDVFANEIFPLVKENVPDAKLKICFPNYWEDCSKDIMNSINKIDGIEILGMLSKDELIKEMTKSKVCFAHTVYPENMPYFVIESVLNYCFIANEFVNCGSKDVVDNYYKIKFKAPPINQSKDYAYWIIDKLINYEKYRNSLIYERNYVMNKFRRENILPLWKDTFDNL